MAPNEFAPCTLSQMLGKTDPWQNNRVQDVYQKIIRSIIKSIVRLELKGIMRGPLDVDNIQIDENYEANIPITANPETVLRSYRQEFVLLMEAILGKIIEEQ
ncbi:hypothetical protein Pyn_16297 [Prunus yedoensis var. nudiflora]|uniref:Uncharacterized protein n=1 Tax=Prunus yedoensis var. nudiflora TaxID=2094558 RepID=A0A314ZQE9_PRUYE|nr:hypothetical protein Pyn_16297 [Prunus yedoensis var. nudiflora]